MAHGDFFIFFEIQTPFPLAIIDKIRLQYEVLLD